ncbi:MAG: hypothetical protein ABIL06_11430, partial [Pseudomonadota bacterium]
AEFTAPISVRLETPLVETVDRKMEDERMLQRITPGALDDVPLSFSLKADTDDESLLLRFLTALDGFKISSLRQCPECDRYFLHTSKRIKEFCSNKCAARKANRDARARIREEDPKRYEVELKKGASRARASYKKRVYGNRKISIQKRPKKYES